MPTSEQLTILSRLFSGCVRFDYLPPMMVFRFKVLPAKPWPLTVARVPAFFTTDAEHHPIDFGEMGYSKDPIKILVEGPSGGLKHNEWPGWRSIESLAEELIARGFDVARVEWFGVRFLVHVRGSMPPEFGSKVPMRVGQLGLGFVFDTVDRESHALRLKMPTEIDIDDTDYEKVMRPGVLLTSGPNEQGLTLSTTCGVCVAAPNGDKLMTCAGHGFPATSDLVYHPTNAPGHQVGSVVWRSAVSDLALVKLTDAITYSQETFSPALEEAVVLRSIKSVGKMSLFDIVNLNTPYNGHVCGSFMGATVDPLLADGKVRFARGKMTYFGNGNKRLRDGCYGAVIWDDDLDAISSFQFVDDKNMTYSTVLEELTGLGYTLSGIQPIGSV